MIEVRGVVKYYQSDRVLDDVSLRVEDGQQLALIGPGGAGKTLLLKIITALVEPDAGEVRVGDTDMNAIGEVELARVRNGMGMLFQNYALFDFMNVEENIAFPLRQRGEHTDAEIREKVDELLAKVDLPGINQKFPNELSGGMKKRVTFARAVIHDPPILFYDDPTAGLDPVTSGKIFKLLRQRREEEGTTSIVITHDILGVREICDDFAFMNHGRLIFRGTQAEIEACEDKFVQQFWRGESDG